METKWRNEDQPTDEQDGRGLGDYDPDGTSSPVDEGSQTKSGRNFAPATPRPKGSPIGQGPRPEKP